GRLVPSRSRTFGRQTEAGLVQLAPWLLLAPWDADVRAGSDVEDTFTVGGRRYRVVSMIRRAWLGEVYGLHAELEEVS
ncbi:MAG TPA: hypothetical protein GX513_08780, partial [Firmicutes bacterium]|nr:hypothetical protein [Bacillota bacterium]